jgi:DeoR family transcriptional regulator, glycerol-3-phosphate regulon repressor
VTAAAAEGGAAAVRLSASDRQARIVDLVTRRGFVDIDTLVRHFGVTPQTIRRDLNQLGAEGRLARYHGGAGLPSSVENVDYAARQVLYPAEKLRIARLAASLIPDRASLFINIGTTTEAVARELVRHQGLRVITNNLNVAVALSRRSDFEIIIAGGHVRNRDGGIVGEATVDLIDQFRVDYGIIGISGIDMDGTMLDYDYREVRVAQAIVRNARRVLLVADHSKFGREAMVRMGSLTQLTAVITDRRPPERIRALLAQAGVQLLIADEADAVEPGSQVLPSLP